MEKRKKEVEVFGVTYDRYVLLQLHRQLTETLGLETVVEMATMQKSPSKKPFIES